MTLTTLHRHLAGVLRALGSGWVLLAWLIVLPAQARVQLEGVSGAQRDNILSHMQLDDLSCDQTPARIRYQYERGPDAVRAALRPFGYYEPDIQSSLEMPADACWQAVFKVDPGLPVLVTASKVEVLGPGAGLAVFAGPVSDYLEDTSQQLFDRAGYVAAVLDPG